MIDIITAVVQLALFVISAFGFGSLFIKRRDIDEGLEYPVFAFSLGLGVIILFTFIFSFSGFLNAWFFAGVLLTGNIIFFVNRKEFKNIKIKIKFSILLVPVFIFLIIDLFYALFPPTFYDSMSYHLAVPNYYILKGGMVPWLDNFYSNLPLNGEMVYLFSLSGGSVLLPRLITFISGLFILILLFSWSGEYVKGKYRILPLILFLSVPQVSFLFSSSKTDIMGMLFLIIGVRSLTNFLKSGKIKKTLFLSGIFLGLAIGTKYIFAFYVAIILIYIFVSKNYTFKRKVFIMITLSAIILITLSPWFVKNIIFTGNPVYPYLNEVFDNNKWGPEQAGQLAEAVKGGKKSISDYILYPFRIFFFPYKYGMTAVWGILLLLFLPFLFMVKREKELIFFLIIAILSFALMIPFGNVPRYFLASFLFLSIPLASGIERTGNKFQLVKRITLPVLLIMLISNLVLTAGLQEKFSFGFRYMKGKVSGEFKGRDIYYLYGLPYYRGVQFINKTLKEGEKVAFVGEDRTFYLKKDFIANSFLDKNMVLEILKNCDDLSGFLKKLQKKGITHIFYSEKGVKMLGSLSSTFKLTREEQDKLDIFLFNFDILYRDKNYILYSVGW